MGAVGVRVPPYRSGKSPPCGIGAAQRDTTVVRVSSIAFSYGHIDFGAYIIIMTTTTSQRLQLETALRPWLVISSPYQHESPRIQCQNSPKQSCFLVWPDRQTVVPYTFITRLFFKRYRKNGIHMSIRKDVWIKEGGERDEGKSEELGSLVSFDFPRSRRGLGQGNTVGGVPIPTSTSQGPSGQSPLATPDQTASRQRVNEQFGGVELTGYPKLGRGIVKRVLVMIIVPPFPHSAPRYDRVFGGVRKHVVRVIAVQVCGRIDQPCEVQYHGISESPGNQECRPKVLAPKAGCHLRWHDVAHVQGKPRVKFLLEPNDRIFHQITEVHFPSHLDDVGMLLDQQPPHVRKEESTRCVVRVGVGFGELVVYAMIPRPVVNAALIGNAVAQHEENTDRQGRFVRSVRPQSMHAYSDTESTAKDRWGARRRVRISDHEKVGFGDANQD